MKKKALKNSNKKEKSELVTVGLFNDEMQNIDKRFDKVEIGIANLKYDAKQKDISISEIKKGHERIINILDKQTKILEDIKDDFQIIKSENKQIKQVIKNKFDIEIAASAA
ncbi:MAG TPA: hypothetical protein DIT25_02345 [Candidatus Moranbacteria bacterium]|nr:hypothetical protein [Candidatus Moranbacteria bacterium]